MKQEQEELRQWVEFRDVVQSYRIAMSNRRFARDNGNDTSSKLLSDIVDDLSKKFEDLEEQVTKEVVNRAREMEIVYRITNAKGIKDVLAATIVSMIDIERADTVSALWRYAGWGVVDGKAERPTKGEKLHYNARLKKACFNVGKSFLMCNSPYRSVYDNAKEFYQDTHEDWPKKRIHLAAMRKMIKVWLSHVWLEWREIEGLPTRSLYVHEKLGHETIYTRAEFGW